MFLRAENVKDTTIRHYLVVVRQLQRFCKRKSVGVNKDSALAFLSGYDNPRTRSRYGIAIKRFFELTKHPDVELFKVPKNTVAKLPNILSVEEVLKLANACDNVRDRALILVAYESSRRNSEVRGLRIRDLKFDEYGAEVRFHSDKSEDANIRLMMSAPSLQTWIEHHKDRDNRDAYVFYGYKKQMTGTRFRQIVQCAARRAGLKRRVWPHLLRHSRIAQLKREKKLSDDDIMNISGHRDRKMLDRYGKITMALTNERLLEIEGLKQLEMQEKRVTKARACPRCKSLNSPLAEFCSRCGMVLDEKVAQQIVKDEEQLQELIRCLPLIKEILEKEKGN